MSQAPLQHYAHATHELYSQHLEGFRTCYVFLPPQYAHEDKSYPVLYLNDGQDAERLRLRETLERLYQAKLLDGLIVVAIPAVHRLQEYGTASMPDYAHRGSKAGQHAKFVVNELLPFINASYRTLKSPLQTAVAGFSLGGLTAIDLAWAHPFQFGKAGVFSGSLWWRKKGLDEGYHDSDRIMHAIIREGHKREGLRVWLQAGTEDEKEDRNNNGIIDAIDDTLDLMHELRQKGYQEGLDFTYTQVEGGQHNFDTWRQVFPDFLLWAFGEEIAVV